MSKDIKILISGDINGLPIHTKTAVEKAINHTSQNRSLIVNFALNYGGRNEILNAVKSIVKDINSSTIKTDDLNEEIIGNYLFTKGLPAPEILIRTGGEKRISKASL
ncbi:Ditrans,polycis-undecaprenyl-diphosphate synthase ((2E,6E)-farnesyl-diphosphate specific) [Sutcliffiella rhizosphaerae]|uniref:Ditrans,polycis-undecaprenyl-diphosphate synthase ((2E,6E)-farnesyl-diphosphate specific) n=1 Tax=Sutcliffiella rhizosphaerae TaxID=2880967 RepID=A0ABM8YP41_9BACI|nr:Ditrans,polycis-undecaprenyl-diphosphate synthase ((2E,6E)-farnesyl-diphosphate specific) [Sutcliffiella rhizosphaerae]